jgi:acetoin utilization protein AcuB
MNVERKDRWSAGAWMTSNPISVAPSAEVSEAFFTLRSEGIRHLLVKEGEKLVGIVTDRDLRRPDLSNDPDGWNDYYRLDAGYTVSDVMTPLPKTVRPGDQLDKALGLMVEEKIGALPVVDKNGAPIGILTTHDMLCALRDLLKQKVDLPS